VRAEREVAEEGDVVVGEVDGFILVFGDAEVLDGGDLVTFRDVLLYKLALACSICSFRGRLREGRTS